MSNAPRDSGLLVVISGPSGVGKTTIVRSVRDRLDGMLSISTTTRPKTDQDQDGVDYQFLSEAQFQDMVEDAAFLEHAQVFGKHWYGTPRAPVDTALAEGRLALLEIDVQGALQVRKNAPGALLLFILPPDEDTLLERLRNRGREDEATIARRFAEARREIALARTSAAYDAFVVNRDLDTAIDDACRIIDEARTARAGA